MTRAVIGGEKVRIEGQPTNTGGTVYIKMSDASLIFVMHINTVFRIGKRKYYILSGYYYYGKRLDWTLSIYLHIVIKSIW